MTAPASWLVYDALLDFWCEPRTGVLRLNPQFTGRFVVIHPLFWGIGQRNGKCVSLVVQRVFGSPPPVVSRIEVEVGAETLRVNGVAAEPDGCAGAYVRFRIPAIVLLPGVEIVWKN